MIRKWQVVTLKDSPRSAQLVFAALESGETKTVAELKKETGMGVRAIRYGIIKLKEQNLVIEKFCWKDARKTLYQKAPV